MDTTHTPRNAIWFFGDQHRPQSIGCAGDPNVTTPNIERHATEGARLNGLAADMDEVDIGDRVFPHFIAAHLPPGVTGLLIAAIFAAAMSTVSTSLNSSATLLMSDYYKRFVKPDASEAQCMIALYAATILWGVLGTAMALSLVKLTESALDIWWNLASIFSGGMVSLFLLGMISRRASNPAAITAIIVGGLVIVWMVFSKTNYWPANLDHLRSPFHGFLVIVIGTLSILLLGIVLSTIWPRQKPGPSDG